jgi:hypothetical protein
MLNRIWDCSPICGKIGLIVMKALPGILDRLNARLSEELTAINQYMVHSDATLKKRTGNRMPAPLQQHRSIPRWPAFKPGRVAK